MKLFFLKRLIRSLPVLFSITLVAFFLVRWVPGDPVQQLLGERGASETAVKEMKEILGLDKPLIVQYSIFLSRFFQGDLGESIVTSQPVLKEFFTYFPATLELSFMALIIALLLGIPMGVIAALKRQKLLDHFLIGFSLLGFSMSVFWWGLVLILIFSVFLGWTPVSGRVGILYDIPHITGLYLIDSWFSEEKGLAFISALKHLILPGLTLATIPLAFIFRITRASFIEVLDQDFVRTAKAKGLGNFKVLFGHVLKNALIPIITIVGFLAGTLLTGAILTETVFSWPGIGRWFVQGVLSRDYPVITGGVLVMAFFIVFCNLLVDVLYGILDPKVKISLTGMEGK